MTQAGLMFWGSDTDTLTVLICQSTCFTSWQGYHGEQEVNLGCLQPSAYSNNLPIFVEGRIDTTFACGSQQFLNWNYYVYVLLTRLCVSLLRLQSVKTVRHTDIANPLVFVITQRTQHHYCVVLPKTCSLSPIMRKTSDKPTLRDTQSIRNMKDRERLRNSY